MNPTTRLRIATRIHFALLRHFNEDVPVGTLLDNGADLREVLWVFDASGVPGLVALAAQCREAFAAPAPPPGGRAAGLPQEAGGSRNTSGVGARFGVSRPPEFGDSLTGPTAANANAGLESWLRRPTLRALR